MRSPLDDVPVPPANDVERTSLRLVFWSGFFLLLFAAGYLIVFPNHEKENFSELTWVDRPHFVVSENGSPNTGSIVFSIRLHSFEKENTSYRVNIQYEGRTIATKNVSLAVGEIQTVDFSIAAKGTLDSQNQIHVLVTKPSADANKSNDAPLELTGYFPD